MSSDTPGGAPPAGPASQGSTRGPVGPVIVEQGFKVDGRKLTVLVTFPGAVAAEFGMDYVLAIANRAVVSVESKSHEVAKVRSE